MKSPARSPNRSFEEEILPLYKEKKAAIHGRLEEFRRVPRKEYFYELAYCLLTPQSSAIHAERTVEHLHQADFLGRGFDPESLLRTPSQYIRFHRTKARHLLAAREQFPEIARVLSVPASPPDLREWLVQNVKGLGYKEASHFLRNIGRNEGLAILDRHILKNLKKHGVIRSVPSSLTRKRYFAIERRFRNFADRIGIPIDELDLLFWSFETGEIRK
ncbi:MAG: N-glycosylase/DNA lyase [Bacteroidota bacterium]